MSVMTVDERFDDIFRENFSKNIFLTMVIPRQGRLLVFPLSNAKHDLQMVEQAKELGRDVVVASDVVMIRLLR